MARAARLALLLLAALAVAYATEDTATEEPTEDPGFTWFVSPVGNNKNTGRSRKQAFRTIEKALSVAQSRDRVILTEGEYNGPHNCGQTIAVDLELRSEDGDPIRNVIDCMGVSSFGLQIQAPPGEPAPKVLLSSFTVRNTEETAIIIGDKSNVVLQKLLLEENHGSRGGAVRIGNGALVQLDNSDIEHNHATHGGAVYADNPQHLFIQDNTRIMHNKAEVDGGAVYQLGGVLRLTAGKWIMEGNEAQGGDGGALFLMDVSAVIGNGPMRFSQAAGNGGGIYAAGDSDLSITEMQLEHSKAGGNGGGLCMRGGSLLLSQVSMRHNSAVNGGGMAITDGISVEARGNAYFFNTAVERGGGMYLKEGHVTDYQDEGEAFDSNIAEGGGGMHIESSTYISFRTEISNNTATTGAGVWLTDSVMSMRNGNIQRNLGGGILCENSKLQMESSELSQNFGLQNLFCNTCEFRCRSCRPCDCNKCADEEDHRDDWRKFKVMKKPRKL